MDYPIYYDERVLNPGYVPRRRLVLKQCEYPYIVKMFRARLRGFVSTPFGVECRYQLEEVEA